MMHLRLFHLPRLLFRLLILVALLGFLGVPEAKANSDVELVSKTVNNPTPALGETIWFEITMRNNGPDAATNVTITDVLSNDLIFLGSACPGGYNGTTDTVCEMGTLANGETRTWTVTVRVNAQGTIVNTATISADSNTNTGNDSGTVTVNVAAPSADLTLTKEASTNTPIVGVTFSYNLSVFNNGPDVATNVVITDVLPAGLELVGVTCPGTYNGNTDPACEMGNIHPGTSHHMMISVRAIAAGTIVNTGTVSSDVNDPNLGDNTATETVTAVTNAVDLKIEKTADAATLFIGGTFSYTISVVNNGTGTATNVVITDVLPAGLTFNSSTCPGYNPNAADHTCEAGNIGPGGSYSFTITVTPNAVGSIVNTASVGSTEPDANPNDNTDSVTVTVQTGTSIADLSIHKTGSTATPFFNTAFTYTITVTNLSTQPAVGVVVTDPLPAGLVFIGSTCPSSYDGAIDPVCELGTIAAGTTKSFSITVRATVVATLINQASVNAVSFDPDFNNNISTFSVNVISGVDDEDAPELPKQVTLDANYPNPFNPQTVIPFALPHAEAIHLAVYDVMGRQVAVLAQGTYTAGWHRVTFQAAGLESGVYFYRLQTPTRTVIQKMTLLK